jgi:hypothetical protein
MKKLFVLLFVAFGAVAQEPICATGERTDEILKYLQERLAHEPRDRAHTLAAAPVVRDGTFVMNGENGVTVNGRSNDLVGTTIEFIPADATHYAISHVPYSYFEPPAAPLRDFSKTGARLVKYDLKSTTLSLFGQSVTAVYLTAFNGLYLSPPSDVNGLQIDDLHAFTQPGPMLSPLLITTSKPSRLAYPKVYAEERDGALIVTWRSESGEVFGYDVQARLFKDGTIDYSYRSARSMRWGAPILSGGLSNLRESVMATQVDEPNDMTVPPNAALKQMVDFTNVEIARINDSDILRVRLKVAATIDPTKLTTGDFLRYIVTFGQFGSAWFDIKPDGSTQTAPIGSNFVLNDPSASYSGNTVTFYVSQSSLPPFGTLSVLALSRVGTNRTLDVASAVIPMQTPPHSITVDLSATPDGTTLELPFTEAFTLPTLNPTQVWSLLKSRYPITDNDVDAIAVYQSFYTDLVFYAGAYSANGNPQVDGIATPSTTYGTSAAKRANVMHMNTLGYGWNSTDQFSTHVIMHEFGHRWLYFLRIKEGDAITSVLNPVSAHPAQYIDTSAAFRVFTDYDASVMGGGVFTPTGDGSFFVRAGNFGYSWTDLYLMGFATPEEVRPWFYVANSSPALGPEYYPPDQINVLGNRHDVTVQQLIDALGPRKPAMANSPKSFRVLFVLVTDDGEATPDQVAAMKKIRQLFETNFKVATGGRAEVRTEFALPGPRRRGVSH